MNRKTSNLYNLLMLVIVFSSVAYAEIKIPSQLLKYKRQQAIDFADKWWNSIAKGYKNFGDALSDISGTIFDTRDCAYFNIPYGSDGITCGGDCTNFVSQCLIAGGIDDEYLAGHIPGPHPQINKTIRNPQDMVDRLLAIKIYNNGRYQMPNNRTVDFEDLKPGDVVVRLYPGTDIPGHSVLIGKTGDDPSSIGFYSHSSCNNANNSRLSDIIDGVATIYLFHFPDVPVISAVSVFEEKKNGEKSEYYYASLDENKNNGNGEICPILKNRNRKTLIPSKDMKLLLKIDFNLSVDEGNKKHSVKLVRYEYSSTDKTKRKEIASIILQRPIVENDDKSLKYTIPVQEIIKKGSCGLWTIEVQAFSKSDGTPINGIGTYEKYADKPDTNHQFRVTGNQINSLWITPGRSLQWDYNSAIASSERTIEGYGYYNYLNKEHIAGKNLKINLLLEADNLESETDENKTAEEKEQDILSKVKEIGQGVLLKYDGSILQTAVTDVKRSDEGSDRYIISYAFKKPGSDGSHLMEAMFTADDENNKAVSFSEGRYLSHSFAVDTVPPDLSLSEKDKTCLDLTGWIVYGRAYDPGDNPSGIGILASWTDQPGYTGYPATGSLDKYKNTPLHYDISVKDFQLGKYDESSFNEYNNVYTNNFIYNPVNGSFQIDDKPIEHAGRLTLVATDKAGTNSAGGCLI